MLSQSVASIVDQFLLSGLNFCVGIILIRITSKNDYGIYTQLFASGLLATTLLDAFIGTTLTTLASRKSKSECMGMIAAALKIQHIFSIVIAVIFGCGCVAALNEIEDHHVPIFDVGIAFAFYVYSLTQREFKRTIKFLEGKADHVLRIDALFVAFVFMGGCVLWITNTTSLAAIFVTLSASNILADLSIFRIKQSDTGIITPTRELLDDIWMLAKWAIPGAMIGWAGNYSYLYLATLFLDLSASADLNASRLLLMPIALVGVAWARVVHPYAGKIIADQNWSKLHRLSIQSAIGMEIVTCTYIGALLMTFSWISPNVLGAKYSNIDSLVLAWGAYFVVNVARNIGTTWLASLGGYSTLFWLGLSALATQCSLYVYMLPNYGPIGAILSLIAVELVELILVWGKLLPNARLKEMSKFRQAS